MLWDEELKQWRPRYGYKRANDEQGQWCIEVPENKGTLIDFKLGIFKHSRYIIYSCYY